MISRLISSLSLISVVKKTTIGSILRNCEQEEVHFSISFKWNSRSYMFLIRSTWSVDKYSSKFNHIHKSRSSSNLLLWSLQLCVAKAER